MFANLTFDELNALVENSKGINFDKFFGEMLISRKAKEKRIIFAKLIEEAMLDVIIYAFVMNQYDRLDVDKLEKSFSTAYRKAIEAYVADDPALILDEYIERHIEETAKQLAETTAKYNAEPYYFSEDRVTVIAENESNSIMNYSEYAEAKAEGKGYKRWIALRDLKTRRTHKEVDRKVIGIDDTFRVGDSLFRFPRDTEYAPSPEEIVNCRCSIEYL